MRHTLAAWPRFQVEINTNGPTGCTATLYLGGRPVACAAPTLDAIRAGVIARCAQFAEQFGRPVALEVLEPTARYRLAVHENGIVQQVDVGQEIPDLAGLEPATGACRHCGNVLPITSSSCANCDQADPLRIEHCTPIAPPQMIRPTPQAPATTSNTAAEAARMEQQLQAVLARTIVVHFTDTGETMRVAAPAALGRKPSREGCASVMLLSPERMVSRTHAIVDVDELGNLLVIDNQSANGVEVDGRMISPTTPTIVASGSRFKLGDVTLRIEAVPQQMAISAENLTTNGVSPI